MRHLGTGLFLVTVLTAPCIESGFAFSTPSRVFVGTPTKANPRLVRDCMTPNPRTLKTTDTVDEAIVALLGAGFNGAPVLDPVTNNLVGCVTAFDFIQREETGAILPFDFMEGGGGGHGGDNDSAENKLQEMAISARKIVATTVGELTTEEALTVHADTSMKDAAELLTRERKHRLCVVDDGDNLVGILSTSDVMRNIVDVLQALPPQATTSSSVVSEAASFGDVAP